MTRTIVIFLINLAVAACATLQSDTACTAFEPITYSAAHDTAETVTQVRQHNAALAALCR